MWEKNTIQNCTRGKDQIKSALPSKHIYSTTLDHVMPRLPAASPLRKTSPQHKRKVKPKTSRMAPRALPVGSRRKSQLTRRKSVTATSSRRKNLQRVPAHVKRTGFPIDSDKHPCPFDMAPKVPEWIDRIKWYERPNTSLAGNLMLNLVKFREWIIVNWGKILIEIPAVYTLYEQLARAVHEDAEKMKRRLIPSKEVPTFAEFIKYTKMGEQKRYYCRWRETSCCKHDYPPSCVKHTTRPCQSHRRKDARHGRGGP